LKRFAEIEDMKVYLPKLPNLIIERLCCSSSVLLFMVGLTLARSPEVVVQYRGASAVHTPKIPIDSSGRPFRPRAHREKWRVA
jgi:hypothetical protein